MRTLAAAPLPGTVLLNGCWSGTAVSRFGRDPFSLAVGALLGGAHTVVAGTGLIGGSASALVGSAVLDLISGGESAGDAVRRAQRSVRDGHPELQPSRVGWPLRHWSCTATVGHLIPVAGRTSFGHGACFGARRGSHRGGPGL